MKILFLLLFACISSFAAPSGGGTNASVQTTATITPARLKAGSTGEIRFMLKPVSGIHINLQPPIQVKFDSTDVLTAVGKADIPAGENPQYFDAVKPIRMPVTISKKTRPGTYTLKGILNYFYCSDAEGWCSNFKQPFEIRLTVVR
jgi:hypothetical protein